MGGQSGQFTWTFGLGELLKTIIIWQAKQAWLEITGKLTKSYFLMFLSYSKIW